MITELNQKIEKYLKDNGAQKVGVFGSYSKGNFSSTSDIDVYVKFKTPKGLFDLSRIQRELTETTGYEIDLVTDNSISPYLANEIKNSLVILYEER